MQNNCIPQEIYQTSQNHKLAQEEIVDLIESVTAAQTFTEPATEEEFFPDFSIKIWEVILLIVLLALLIKSTGPDYVWDYANTIVVIGFGMGICFLVTVMHVIFVAGAWVAHKLAFRFRRSKSTVEAVRHTKITDADLELIAANRFIKEWLLEALNKYDTLTYFMLHKDRYKISHKANTEVEVAEKKRIRTLING